MVSGATVWLYHLWNKMKYERKYRFSILWFFKPFPSVIFPKLCGLTSTLTQKYLGTILGLFSNAISSILNLQWTQLTSNSLFLSKPRLKRTPETRCTASYRALGPLRTVHLLERVKFVWTNSGTWMQPKILDLTLKLNRLAETDEMLDTSMFHDDPDP